MSDAFIREVDEDLRQKQLNNLWSKFGKFIIGAAIGIVLVVAGRSIYTYMSESKYNEQAEAFTAALKLNSDNVPAALDQIIASDIDGYEIAGAFKKAELAIAAGDKGAAIAALDDFINTASVPQIYLDMASVQAALLVIDTASVDQIRSRLSLLISNGSKFQYLASELVALAELKAGETDAAKAKFEALIGNVEIPATTKSRAEQYLSVIE